MGKDLSSKRIVSRNIYNGFDRSEVVIVTQVGINCAFCSAEMEKKMREVFRYKLHDYKGGAGVLCQ